MYSLKYLPFVFLLACTTAKKDPLENSKKLISQGHASLYTNGAFEVPMVEIKLIPPGPKTLDLTTELLGINARQSFLLYLGQAQKSFEVIYKGTKKSYKFSREVDQVTKSGLYEIGKSASKQSVIVLEKGQVGLDILSETLPYSLEVSKNILASTYQMEKDFREAARDNKKSFDDYLKKVDHEQTSVVQGQGKLDKFVVGYVALPQKLQKNLDEVQEVASLETFKKNTAFAHPLREKMSAPATYLISSTVDSYKENVNASLANFDEIDTEDRSSYGATLDSFRAMGWVLDAIFWQGLFKPAFKTTAGAIGYLVINGIVYPVTLAAGGSYTVAEIAVEVTLQSLDSTYKILAPTGELALSAILDSGSFAASVAGKNAMKVAKHVTTATIDGFGLVTTNTLRYVGVPFSATMIAAGGAVSGVAVGTATTAAAGALKVTGETTKLLASGVSLVASSAVLVTGVTAYTIKGTSQIAYNIAMSTAVPSGVILGNGMVLSYGTLINLSAHAALAVSDCAYLVLSMEGPNWVVYAVKGKLGMGENLSQKTVLNLEEMQKNGEEFYKVPVTPEEMKKIIDATLEH